MRVRDLLEALQDADPDDVVVAWPSSSGDPLTILRLDVEDVRTRNTSQRCQVLHLGGEF